MDEMERAAVPGGGEEAARGANRLALDLLAHGLARQALAAIPAAARERLRTDELAAMGDEVVDAVRRAMGPAFRALALGLGLGLCLGAAACAGPEEPARLVNIPGYGWDQLAPGDRVWRVEGKVFIQRSGRPPPEVVRYSDGSVLLLPGPYGGGLLGGLIPLGRGGSGAWAGHGFARPGR